VITILCRSMRNLYTVKCSWFSISFFITENGQAVTVVSEQHCIVLQIFFNSGTAKDDAESKKCTVSIRWYKAHMLKHNFPLGNYSRLPNFKFIMFLGFGSLRYFSSGVFQVWGVCYSPSPHIQELKDYITVGSWTINRTFLRLIMWYFRQQLCQCIEHHGGHLDHVRLG
jgi:hypothetical protein